MPRIPRHPSRGVDTATATARADAASRRWRQFGSFLLLGGGALAWLGELARTMASP